MLEYAWSIAQPWLAVAAVLAICGGSLLWALRGQDRLKQPWGVVPREALATVEEIECDGCARHGAQCLSCDYLVCNTREEAQRRAGLPSMRPAAANPSEAGCAVEGGWPSPNFTYGGKLPVVGVDMGGPDYSAESKYPPPHTKPPA